MHGETVTGGAETSAMNLGNSVDENCSKIDRENLKTQRKREHCESSKVLNITRRNAVQKRNKLQSTGMLKAKKNLISMNAKAQTHILL